jgi:hypothetical protein
MSQPNPLAAVQTLLDAMKAPAQPQQRTQIGRPWPSPESSYYATKVRQYQQDRKSQPVAFGSQR